MKVDALLELGVQPTDFAKVKSNAERVFGGDVGFYVVEKDDPTNRSDMYVYKDEGIESPEDQEDFKEIALEKFLSVKNLKPSQVKVVTIDAATPNFDSRGNLLSNQASTYSQRVTDTMGAYKDSKGKNSAEQIKQVGAITVNNVKEIIGQHPDTDKHVHMNSLIDKLIEGSGRPWVPQVIVDGVSDNNITADLKVGKYLADFGEIGGPIGLVCSSINGNAGRVLPNFFGVSGKPASLNDIKNNAVIHFHPSKGHSLVDSYIEYNGQIVRVSSKAAGDKMSGGSGATFAGIYQSIAEIATTDEGRTAFNKLIAKRPGAKEGLRKLKILANVLVDDEGDSSRALESFDAFKTKLILLQELLKNTQANKYKLGVTNDDLKILGVLWQNSGSMARLHNFKSVMGAALGSRVDQDLTNRDTNVATAVAQLGGKKFSPGFFNLLRSFKLNIFGEPTTGGAEDPSKSDKSNSQRGWWLRLQKSIVYAVANQVNSDPEFSLLCTWILNHGKFIQIDTRSAQQNGALLITNITATWPSTAVDRVILVPNSINAGFKYKLLINSNRDWRQEMKQNYADASQAKDYADDSFGFADTKEKMKTNQVDLARMNRHWESLIQSGDSIGDIIGGDERRASFSDRGTRKSNLDNRRSNARLGIDNLFTNLAKLKVINKPTNDAQQNTAVGQIVSSILTNSLSEEQYSYVRRAVEYSLKYLHAASKNKDEYVNVNEDEEDDDDEETGDNSVEITKSKRQIGTEDLARASQLMWPVYYAFRINQSILDGEDYASLAQELKTSLDSIGVNLNIAQLLTKRTNNSNLDATDFTPPGAKVRGEPKNMKPEAVRAMIAFLNKYNLYSDELSAGRGSQRVHTDHGVVGDSTAKTYRFCTAILFGKYDSNIKQLSRDFVTLLQNEGVKNLIAWETKNSRMTPSFDQIKHDDSIYNNELSEATGPRGYDTEDKVLSSITLIYWTLIIKRYVEVGQALNTNDKFVRTIQTAKSVANGVIRDKNNRPEYLRAINAIVARGGQQLARHDATQTRASISNEPAPQDIVKSAISDPRGKIQQLRARMSPAKRREFDSEMNDMIANGDSVEQIQKEAHYYLGESRIMRGILR